MRVLIQSYCILCLAHLILSGAAVDHCLVNPFSLRCPTTPRSTTPLHPTGSTRRKIPLRWRSFSCQINTRPTISGTSLQRINRLRTADRSPRNGRWRALYTLPLPSSSPPTASAAPSPNLTGSIKLDVHYYEDGNVRLITTKPVSVPLSSPALTASSGPAVLRQIAGIEKRYQEELNRAFGSLSEGAFKALRRQLPVTRQKVEWERVGGYRVRLPQRPGWIVSRLTVRMV